MKNNQRESELARWKLLNVFWWFDFEPPLNMYSRFHIDSINNIDIKLPTHDWCSGVQVLGESCLYLFRMHFVFLRKNGKQWRKLFPEHNSQEDMLFEDKDNYWQEPLYL